jgi:hypothetical protein
MSDSEANPRLTLTVEYEDEPHFGVIARYAPWEADGVRIDEWTGRLHLPPAEMPIPLRRKMKTLSQVLTALIPSRSVTFPDGTRSEPARPHLQRIILSNSPEIFELLTGDTRASHRAYRNTPDTLTMDQHRLWSDIMASLEAECWKDLRIKLNVSEPVGHQVFISYRKRPDIEQFAEALATRIEQEGIRARFDKWDIVPGDSLPGKLAEAFEATQGCILILSSDFEEGKWAKSELHTAISKRVDEGYRVIPVLFEDSPIPQLIKEAVRVDFRDHNSDLFEERVREIIGAILGLTGRPFTNR